MTEIQQEIIRTAMKQMVAKGWFDICTFDQCAKLAQIPIPGELHDALRPLHCVSWGNMSNELREWVQQSILSFFSLPSFEAKKMDAVGSGETRSFFGKLLRGPSA